MIWIFVTLFTLSAAGNVVLVWYVRKLMKNFTNGVKGVEEFQGMLQEYVDSLESMLQLDQYYGDDAATTAVKNTKLVVEACKSFKKVILEEDGEDGIDTEQTR